MEAIRPVHIVSRARYNYF